MAAMAVAGCGSGPTDPGDDPPYDFSFTDPKGDTAAATTNPEQVKASDLVSVAGRVDADNLVITLAFAEPITPWTKDTSNALDGFVLLDTDTTQSTGLASQTHGLGADFYVDLRDDGFGRMALVDVQKRSFVRVDAKFEDSQVTITVPRGAIATQNDVDGRLRMAIDIAGRRRAPDVDTSPSTDFHRLEPPRSQ